MLLIQESKPFEFLNQFATLLNGNIYQKNSVHTLQVNNENANGVIHSFTIFNGFDIRIYDITYLSDVNITLLHSKENLFRFVYVVKGQFQHKFSTGNDLVCIRQNQNLIFSGAKGDKSEILLPKNDNLEIIVLHLNKSVIEKNIHKSSRQLNKDLNNILATFSGPATLTFKSTVDLQTLPLADSILKASTTSIVGRLMIEGLVLQMLASQIKIYNRTNSKTAEFTGLTDLELAKISELEGFIKENIDKKLTVNIISEAIGVKPKKLQIGAKYLYNISVNTFIMNVRFKHAKELIATTDMTMSEICYKIGLLNRSYFSKKFAERYGILPNRYKQALQNNKTLFELIYISNAVQTTTQKDINDILQVSIVTNNKLEITGCLVYFDSQFIQILEGSKTHILELYQKIKKDNRHKNVTTLWKGIKINRHFEEWNMAFTSESERHMINLNGNSMKVGLVETLKELERAENTTEELKNKLRFLLRALI